MLAHHPLITASDRLYFAYGSNLSPEQMAHRCPDSIFLGKATLRGHRWQVNERGVANIVPVPVPAPAGTKGRGSSRSGERRYSRDRDGHDDHTAATAPAVEGLLYAVSAADERRLDRYEGVAKGWYEKFGVQVDFEPVRGNVFARCTSASVARAVREERKDDELGGDKIVGVERRARSWDEGEGEGRRSGRRDGGGGRRGASVGSSSSSLSSSSVVTGGSGLRSSILGLLGIPSKMGRAESPSPARGGRERVPRVVSTPVVALVYASTAYVRDGDVRSRYVPRMERAVGDAVALGVSRGFVERTIVPQVWGNRPDWKSLWRMSLTGGEEGLGKDKGRREVEESARRRSVAESDGSGRRGRRDSVLDRRRDY